MRLMETARGSGAEAYLIDDVSELDVAWLLDVGTVGISAGASAPETLVQGVVEYFKTQGVTVEDFVVRAETMTFAEPLELMRMKSAGADNPVAVADQKIVL